MKPIKFNYYQHSYIQNIVENPIPKKLSFKEIENNYTSERGGDFASYITEFDCEEETKWWFTIKDDEYDLSVLNSHDRRNILSYKKKCNARRINPLEFSKELFNCYVKSFDAYPVEYRPKVFNYDVFLSDLNDWNNSNYIVYACFRNESSELIGFALIELKGDSFQMRIQKTNPEYENCRSNAALMDTMLNDYNEIKKSNPIFYISNGSRSIKHKTNFNSYLEKYFGFRKAYAKLRIVYKFPIGIIVKILKPFRFLLKNTKNPFLYNIYCVLKMDSFRY